MVKAVIDTIGCANVTEGIISVPKGSSYHQQHDLSPVRSEYITLLEQSAGTEHFTVKMIVLLEYLKRNFGARHKILTFTFWLWCVCTQCSITLYPYTIARKFSVENLILYVQCKFWLVAILVHPCVEKKSVIMKIKTQV